MGINTLSDISVKSAKPKNKPYKLFDGGGLYLIVTPQNGKWWRLKYRFGGKEKLISLGVYPTITLKRARELRDEAKRQLAERIDPMAVRQSVVQEKIVEEQNTFSAIAREWFDKFSLNWTPANSKKVLARLENDMFPFLGKRELTSISAPELLAVLQKVEARGAIDTAHRILQDCGRIFRYAVATGRAHRDPAADLKGALPPTRKSSFATIIEPEKIGLLLNAIDDYTGGVIVKCALKLAPLFFVRPGELRQAQWNEFNFEAKEWRIPAARMKMRQVHIVPLAHQAISVLEELRQFTGEGIYLFPSPRTNIRPISDMALLNALRSMGFNKDEMTVHGFRSMASTLLNEQGFNRDWIERQLAHGERDSIRAAYNYAEYLPERRLMMQKWADYLHTLRDSN